MYKDFEQKKRNRPIAITDRAISKVRCIQFQGFKAEHNKYIQEQHKLLLEIAKKYNESNEVGILINIIDWSAWLIIGNGNMVETKDNPDAYAVLKSSRKNTLLFMHNHPSTTTFSGTEFKTFCSNDSLYMITVVGNDGSVRALIKESSFDANEALAYYNTLATVKYKNYSNNGTLAMRELLKIVMKLGYFIKTGGMIDDQQASPATGINANYNKKTSAGKKRR